jgi:hypothetical protein
MSYTPEQIKKMKQKATSVQSFSPEQLMQMKNGQTQEPRYANFGERFAMGAGTEAGNQQYMQRKGISEANKPGFDMGDVGNVLSSGLSTALAIPGAVAGTPGMALGGASGELLRQLIGRTAGTRPQERGLAGATKALTSDVKDVNKEVAYNLVGGKLAEVGAKTVVPFLAKSGKKLLTATSGLGSDTVGKVGTWVMEQAKNYPKEVKVAQDAINAGKDVYYDYANKASKTLGDLSKKMTGDSGFYSTTKNKIFEKYADKPIDMSGGVAAAKNTLSTLGEKVVSSTQKSAVKQANKLIGEFEKAGDYSISAVDKFNQTMTDILETGIKREPTTGRAPSKKISDVYSKVAAQVKNSIKEPFYKQVPELGGINSIYKDYKQLVATLSKIKDPVGREKFMTRLMSVGNTEVRNALQTMDDVMGTNLMNELKNIRAAELLAPPIKSGSTAMATALNLGTNSPALVGLLSRSANKIEPLIKGAAATAGYVLPQIMRAFPQGKKQ